MALYVSMVLMGAVATVPADDLDDSIVVAAVIWGAALGHAVAHWFAFTVAAHLFRGQGLHRDDAIRGGAEAAAALAVAVVATAPLLVWSDTTAAGVALIALAAVVTVVAYVASRTGGLGRTAALVRAAVTMVAAVIVAVVKIALSH